MNVALTQAPPEPDLFEIFQEVKERGSIAHPHLVTVETDSEGKETLTPHHFFQKESTISVGVGSREPKPDVMLDKTGDSGPSMSQFGLSNQAFSIKFEGGSTLQLAVFNRFPLKYFEARGGVEKSVGGGGTLLIGDGDEIRFAKGAPFPKIRFIFPGWEDPLLKEVKAKATAIIGEMVKRAKLRDEKEKEELQLQMGQQQRAHDERIALLHGKLKELGDARQRKQ